METIVRERGTSGRTDKPALVFAVADAAENVCEAMRNMLAREAIDNDEETKDHLDEAQKRLLARNFNRAKSDIKQSIWRAYRNPHLLGRANSLRHIDLGQITLSTAGGIVEFFRFRLLLVCL